MAFFPLYPLLIRIVGSLLGNHLVAGLLISNVSFFFGLLYLYKLLEREYDRAVARRAIFYASIFPTAIFFSAVYPESLFFVLTVASFYYMRTRSWLLAAILGFFAALTRVEGVLLIVPFLIEWLTQNRPMPQSSLYGLASGLLIPLGLSVYMAYLWVLRADPLYFSHVQIHWNRHLALPWVSVANAFGKVAPRSRRTSRRKPIARDRVHLPHDRRFARWLAPVAPVVYCVHGALDSRADVHLEPHVDAAVRARPLSHVRHPRALGRPALGQQRDTRLLTASAWAFHGPFRRLVLGCIIGAASGNSSSSESSALREWW